MAPETPAASASGTPAPTTPATGTPTDPAVAPAGPEVISGLTGQSAAEQTCSVGFFG